MFIITTILTILLSIILLLYVYCAHKFTYWKSRGVPYKKPTFIFGNLLDIVFASEPASKLIASEINKSNSKYFGFYGFTKPLLITTDTNLIKNMLVKDHNVFPDRAMYNNENVEFVMSYSLFGLKSPEWNIIRKLLSPAFTSGKLKMMMQLMMTCGENLKKYVSDLNGKPVDMKGIAAKYTMDVISSCAFGIDANSFANENSDIRKYGLKLFSNSLLTALKKLSYVFAPILVKTFRYPFFDSVATDFFRKVFLDVFNTRENSKIKRNDLVDILIENKDQAGEISEFNLKGDKAVAQAIMFFGAGYETTSSTIAFTLHEICVNPNIQDKLRKEMNSSIERHGGLTYEAIQDMKYLHMVVCETLRKYPITPFIQRTCNEDYRVEETGLTIEKGTPVLIPQHALQWDPEYFPNPEIFDPERFNETNIHKINNYVYMPFGKGPRICIGERFGLLSAKLGLVQVIKNFQLRNDSEIVGEIKYTPNVLLQSKDGVRLICTKA